jgi:cytochrome c553
MRPHLLAVLALATLSACDGEGPDTQAAAPANPGIAKFETVCKDCHGQQGQGQGRFPKLAGRAAGDLAAKLRLYKSGHKSGNMSDTMRPFAQALSESEIDQIAAYLAAK